MCAQVPTPSAPHDVEPGRVVVGVVVVVAGIPVDVAQWVVALLWFSRTMAASTESHRGGAQLPAREFR
jgi:hypothetical protein